MANQKELEENHQTKWRPNVLILFAIAYGVFLAIFCISVWKCGDPIKVFELISVPFVALISGTIAVVKDIL
ncbi:MAG: hypothetical protein F4X72_05915 [Dehalococcoidia bacterium]|nr:hypothetical protein [Dehalococcoidia bacterium]